MCVYMCAYIYYICVYTHTVFKTSDIKKQRWVISGKWESNEMSPKIDPCYSLESSSAIVQKQTHSTQ